MHSLTEGSSSVDMGTILQHFCEEGKGLYASRQVLGPMFPDLGSLGLAGHLAQDVTVTLASFGCVQHVISQNCYLTDSVNQRLKLVY